MTHILQGWVPGVLLVACYVTENIRSVSFRFAPFRYTTLRYTTLHYTLYFPALRFATRSTQGR
jgi:hypothetical protein